MNYFKNHTLLFVIFYLCISHCWAQSIRELEDKLKTAPVEDKPAILNQLSEASLTSSTDKSINYAEQALKLAKQSGDINEESSALINLGNGYDAQGNHKKAISNYKDALILFEQYKQFQNAGFLWNKIADANLIEGKQQDAIEANQKALVDYKLAKDKKGIANILLEIGDIYFYQKKYENALDYYNQALKNYEDVKDARMTVNVLSRIGSAYSNWGNYNQANTSLNNALDLARKNKMNSEVETISKNLEILKKNQGNFQKSQTEFAQQQKKQQLQQISSLSVEKVKSIEEIEKLSTENQIKEFKIKAQQDEILKKQLETDNKAKEIELLNKDKKIQESQFLAELKQQTLLRNLFIGGFVLALCLTFISIKVYRQRIRSNALIALKNEEISRQKANIIGQEAERKRIAEELHDGIGGNLAAIKLNLVRVNSSQNNIPELESIITSVGDACKEIRTISHNLAPPALTYISFIEVLNEVIQKFIVPGKININFDYSSSEELNHIAENIKADTYRIIQELLTNIAKYANASQVEIDLSKQGDDLFLLVEDNGSGFDLSAVRKGIGLKNIESRVNLHNGKINIDSKKDRGTAINIHIPLSKSKNNTSV